MVFEDVRWGICVGVRRFAPVQEEGVSDGGGGEGGGCEG